MARKRKVFYPTSSGKKRAPGPSGPGASPSLVTIDTTAGMGREGLKVGSRVRILGTGIFAGEVAVVERLVGGAIPAAVVRTEAGKTRQARTVDLEPAPLETVPAPRQGESASGSPDPS
jgi:hypothetical protein